MPDIATHGWRMTGWSGAGTLLLLPLAAMAFTGEVKWTRSDFAVAAVLLGATGMGVEAAMRASRNWLYRGATVLAVGNALLVTCANLAVGLISDEAEPVNAVFVAIVAVGAIGAAAVRGRPRALALVVLTMAAAQVTTAALAFATGWPDALPIAILAAPWLVSAVLFARAGRAA